MKIYINDIAVLLSKEPILSLDINTTNVLQTSYKTSKDLLHTIEYIENSKTLQKVVIFHPNLQKLKADFKSLYKKIAAAGGLVFNELGQLLLIFRRGKWDLPKGKLENGETKKEGAMREVMEETGIGELTIISKIALPANNKHCSWHTYNNRHGQRILKKTYWYLMESNGSQTLTPQIEEDIEQAAWFTPNKLDVPLSNTYRSIIAVVQNGKQIKWLNEADC
ncbi:MAG: NUDIX hydrolase [Chitinophagales bacterium]